MLQGSGCMAKSSLSAVLYTLLTQASRLNPLAVGCSVSDCLPSGCHVRATMHDPCSEQALGAALGDSPYA